MIEKSFFKKIKVLDGGMGQELLSKGLKAKGSLWSATALIEEKYHQLVVDTHLEFINAGANVIVTNNFSARRARMIENKVNNLFSYANEKAGELAVKSKELSNKEIMIAGSLPAQNDTYIQDYRDVKIIEENFNDQAQCLKSYVDFYYLDVLSSSLECEIALNAISQIGLSTLVGLHVKSRTISMKILIEDYSCRVDCGFTEAQLECGRSEALFVAAIQESNRKFWELNRLHPVSTSPSPSAARTTR